MMRRMGRPGLVGMAARTAVVAGTATAVSGAVAGHQADKANQAAQAQAYDAQQQQAAMDAAAAQAVANAQAAAPPPAPAAPAPAAGPGAWERAVRWWRAAPGALLEPWAGSCVNSIAAVEAFRAEVPGVRLLVDTGHVADWGEDPGALLPFADHVQLRQGCRGRTQVHVDDPAGTVDFAAVLARLDELGYRGSLSVEYFDLPEHGWPLADPRGWARDLRGTVLALQTHS